MLYSSSLVLPAIVVVSALGAVAVCVVLVWYGPAPESDEQPERAQRRLLVTRVAHAGALVCFVLATGLAVVAVGAPRRDLPPPNALGREPARHDAVVALVRETTDVRAQLSDLDARLRRVESHAAAAGPRERVAGHRADGARPVDRAQRPDGPRRLARSRPGPGGVVPSASITAAPAGREPTATDVPSAAARPAPEPGPVAAVEAAGPEVPRTGAGSPPTLAVDAPGASPAARDEVPESVAAIGGPVPAVPGASAGAPPAVAETVTVGDPSPVQRARRWLAAEAQEMRDTVRAEIEDARGRLDRVVQWLEQQRRHVP
jgi:hypothetical protein